MDFNLLNKNKFSLFTIILFAIIYASISLVNHYYFRTFAWDLGINNNAVYDYAHFRWNDCMLLQPPFKNILSDHFTLIPVFVSPLYWVFGSYTMLVVQIISIIFGGIGAYHYVKYITNDIVLANLAIIHFFTTWGIFSALSFDYHDNVVGAMFVPWFLLFFQKKKWFKTSFFLILILISKENLALWSTFICIGLALHNFKNRKLRNIAGALALIAILYFFVIVKIVIPSLANENREYLHLNYTALGNNFGEIINSIITKPVSTFKLLFINHSGDPVADGIKMELYTVILLSGGIALFIKPHFLIMLIPVIAQKVFNDDIGKWGINYQYSIEFTPILTVALFHAIKVIKSKPWQIYTAITLVLSTILISTAKLDRRKSLWYNAQNSRFYQKQHYISAFNVKQMHKDLKHIPDNVKVSASSPLVPHLAFRDYIYQFPVVNDADYILILSNYYFPINKEELERETINLMHSENWKLIYNQNLLLIFKRTN